ncbi:glycosyltransferase family 9 protein [Nitrospira sp. Nam74]
MPRTLFILHPGSLGDVLLALPAIRAFRASFPDHVLGLMAQVEVSRLLLTTGEVHKAFALEGPSLANMFAGVGSIDPEIKQWLLSCDVAAAWVADPGHDLEAALRQFRIAHILVSSPHAVEYRSVHQVDRFLETIKSVVSLHSHSTTVQLPPDTIQDAATRLTSIRMLPSRPLVIIHPGSGSRHKCVDPQLLTDLYRQYRSNGILPLVVGGPADVDQVTALRRSCCEPFRVMHNLDLVRMAGVIAHADCFIGHDSGLTHLAACLQVPTVALFGPTDPIRWAPRGSHVTVVTGASCHCQGWEAVRGCAEKLCLQITLEQVLSACPPMCRSGIQPAAS